MRKIAVVSCYSTEYSYKNVLLSFLYCLRLIRNWSCDSYLMSQSMDSSFELPKTSSCDSEFLLAQALLPETVR